MSDLIALRATAGRFDAIAVAEKAVTIGKQNQGQRERGREDREADRRVEDARLFGA